MQSGWPMLHAQLSTFTREKWSRWASSAPSSKPTRSYSGWISFSTNRCRAGRGGVSTAGSSVLDGGGACEARQCAWNAASERGVATCECLSVPTGFVQHPGSKTAKYRGKSKFPRWIGYHYRRQLLSGLTAQEVDLP